MRPVTKTQTGVGASAWIPTDYLISPFNVGLAAVISGTVTYSIQHTFDNVLDPSVTPTVFDHASLVGQTTNRDGNYAFPVRAIRVNVTAGTGSVVLTVIQAGK